MNKVHAALAVALVGVGCGAGDGGEVEAVETVELGLSNTNFADIGPLPQPSSFQNPVIASKRLNPLNFNVWTIAIDPNASNALKYSAFISQIPTNSAWTTVTGATGVSTHSATSWMGCSGVDTNRNIAIGWIESGGTAKVQISNSGSAVNLLPTPLNLGSGNLTNMPPALAWANGKLLMVTVRTAPSNPSKRSFRFKWATADCGGSIGSWSSWINLPEGWFTGGAAAAATSSTVISVMGVGSDSCSGGPETGFCTGWMGRINVPSVGAPAFSGNWIEIPSSTASFSPFNTVFMVNQSANGTSSARLISRGATGPQSIWTAVTSSATSTGPWSSINNSNCNPAIYTPTLAIEKNVFGASPQTFRVAAGCNPLEKLRFSSLTP